MSQRIILKKNPKIEFLLLDQGFQLTDEQTEGNSGFYAYDELINIALDKTWYPRFAKFLRAFTWILNGVPLFPDAESCKKAKVILEFRKMKLGLWLTDSYMIGNAKLLKKLLDNTKQSNHRGNRIFTTSPPQS